MTKKTYTMKDVAAHAGVTQPTVSHVINGTASISKEVRDRVNRVIKELGYRPNALAKGLKTNKTNIIGLIIPDITNGYYAFIAKETEKNLAAAGYASFLACTSYDALSEEKCVENFLQYNVDGIIIAYQFKNREPLKKLTRMNKPFVVLEDESDDMPYCHVNTDNVYGGYCAAKHLIEQGRRKIAFLCEPMESGSIANRHVGYKKALEEAGIALPESYVITAEKLTDKFKTGVELGERASKLDIDGIVVTSDEIAFGVLREMSVKHIRVPEDVAVVSYDDIPMAQLITPALTTVSQPISEMVRYAIEFLLKLMQDDKTVPLLRLKPSLIIRETA